MTAISEFPTHNAMGPVLESSPSEGEGKNPQQKLAHNMGSMVCGYSADSIQTQLQHCHIVELPSAGWYRQLPDA